MSPKALDVADLSVIYDHKAPEIRYAIVVIDDESSSGLNYESANFVSHQLFASVALALERRRIHDSLDRYDLTFHILGRQPEVV